MDWIILQLSDSGLPVGGFVCSGGLESSMQQLHLLDDPEYDDIKTGSNHHPTSTEYDDIKTGSNHHPTSTLILSHWIAESLDACFYANFTLLRRVFSETSSSIVVLQSSIEKIVEKLKKLDGLAQVHLASNNVQKRASTTQGASYLNLAATSFKSHLLSKKSIIMMENDANSTNWDILHGYREAVKRCESPGHLIVSFSLVCLLLDITLDQALHLFLFMHCRTCVSSAIRLGLIGPYRGQELLLKCKEWVEMYIEKGHKMMKSNRSGDSPLFANDQYSDEYMIWTTNPVLDILQSGHDRLYTRLFNS